MTAIKSKMERCMPRNRDWLPLPDDGDDDDDDVGCEVMTGPPDDWGPPPWPEGSTTVT